MKRRVAAAAGLLAIVALAVTYYAYERDLAAAYARTSKHSMLADTACGPIEYASTGQGPAILLIHGAGGGFDQGLDFGKALARQGFRAIAMSRFGYLRTPLPPDASPAAQADAHACLLDVLGIDRVAVIGASAGAPSALQLALRHRERVNGLVLLVPALYMPDPNTTLSSRAPGTTQFFFDGVLRSDVLFWLASKLGRRTLTHSLLATPQGDVDGAPPDEKRRVAMMLDHILPVSERRLGLLNDAAVVVQAPRYDLERIAVPTLVIAVANDLFGIYEGGRYTARNIPGARFIGYPTGGHVWVGHQHEVVAEITRFADASEPRPSITAP